MPTANAEAGHGVTFAYEQDPVSSQGTFTTVAQLFSDIKPPDLMRTFTKTTPHNATISQGIIGVMDRSEITFQVNWINDDSSHDVNTGLYSCVVDGLERGFRFLGPGGSAGDDEWIFSGFVTNVSPNYPARDGQKVADISINPSGPMIVDGVTVGT